MHQTNWLLPSKVKHAFLIVAADRQQRNALAVHNCVLASQSPLTGSCSGVQSKTNRTCRVPNDVFMSRENVLLAARLLLCRPPCGEQLRCHGLGSSAARGTGLSRATPCSTANQVRDKQAALMDLSILSITQAEQKQVNTEEGNMDIHDFFPSGMADHALRLGPYM